MALNVPQSALELRHDASGTPKQQWVEPTVIPDPSSMSDSAQSPNGRSGMVADAHGHPGRRWPDVLNELFVTSARVRRDCQTLAMAHDGRFGTRDDPRFLGGWWEGAEDALDVALAAHQYGTRWARQIYFERTAMLATATLRKLSKSLCMATPHEPSATPATIAADAPMSDFYRACASEAQSMHQEVTAMLGEGNDASLGIDDQAGAAGGLRAHAVAFRARLQGASDAFELLGRIDDADAFLACMRLLPTRRRAALCNAWSATVESSC